MKFFTAIATLAMLAIPLATADPNVQNGTQTGMFWGESTFVAAQGGTTFLLAGVVGDHDVTFWDANGRAVGTFIACGPDQGTVPASAVFAQIRVWDHTGGAVPQCLASQALPTGSTWIYVDGL